jgi:chromosomal replication initiator protein
MERVLWEKCLDEIKKHVRNYVFETWFGELTFLKLSGNTLKLLAKDKVVKEYVEKHYLPLIKETASKHFGRYLDVEITVKGENKKPVQLELNLTSPSGKTTEIPSNLNPKYTFENFVVGSSNQFAHAVAVAVAENPGRAYNPLFIYGGVGLGKTHLMQAIGNFIKQNMQSKTVVYITTENFMNELIDALRNDRMSEFREKYRTVDVLLVDDIQFISGKDRTQIEFFHTFNALYDAGKQIVLTSDRPPKDIPMLTDRLRSRFEWGIIADIQPPDFETRMAILRKKAEIEGIEVSDDILRLIASAIRSNIRQLEGALLKIKALANLEGREIDEDLVKTVLGIEPTFGQESSSVNVERIKSVVCEAFGVSVEQLNGNSRKKQIALARQVAMYLARKLGGLSLPKIASAFNRNDHTTVLHAVSKIEEVRKTDEELDNLILSIEEKLKKSGFSTGKG